MYVNNNDDTKNNYDVNNNILNKKKYASSENTESTSYQLFFNWFPTRSLHEMQRSFKQKREI